MGVKHKFLGCDIDLRTYAPDDFTTIVIKRPFLKDIYFESHGSLTLALSEAKWEIFKTYLSVFLPIFCILGFCFFKFLI